MNRNRAAHLHRSLLAIRRRGLRQHGPTDVTPARTARGDRGAGLPGLIAGGVERASTACSRVPAAPMLAGGAIFVRVTGADGQPAIDAFSVATGALLTQTPHGHRDARLVDDLRRGLSRRPDQSPSPRPAHRARDREHDHRRLMGGAARRCPAHSPTHSRATGVSWCSSTHPRQPATAALHRARLVRIRAPDPRLRRRVHVRCDLAERRVRLLHPADRRAGEGHYQVRAYEAIPGRAAAGSDRRQA